MPAGAVYVHPVRPAEVRAELDPDWIQLQEDHGVRFIGVVRESMESVVLKSSASTDEQELSLYEPERLLEALSLDDRTEIWLDITGLDFGTWAVLIRATLAAGITMKVVYAEPDKYQASPSPLDRLRFNLSDRTRGPAPLPGFTKLTVPTPEEAILVPFLGFEGDRLQRVLEEMSYGERRTFPIVGLPGFRAEYPFYSLDANSRSLSKSPMHRNVRLARANCAFEAYLVVDQLRSDEAVNKVVLAPIGTKPHALGALLQAITDEDGTTLIYDHPVRSADRTTGAGRVSIYDVSSFIEMLGRIRE